ncbi:unnamed protein product [Tenebrio molitor]|jgi:hypothetical protein|nr:unnamed protein product [Tenebrio molitor]
MEDKTYGIKTHLVEEFRELQISRRKSTMVFVGSCTLFINRAPVRVNIEAGNGAISITPFPLLGALVGYRIPPQRLNLIFPNQVSIELHPALIIHLMFSTDEEKLEFIGHLNLRENESSSEESGSSSGPSTDSGIQNV